MCDYDLSMCPKYAARTLEELSWESISQTEDLKRRGSRRGSFGAQSVGDMSWSVLWCFSCNILYIFMHLRVPLEKGVKRQ